MLLFSLYMNISIIFVDSFYFKLKEGSLLPSFFSNFDQKSNEKNENFSFTFCFNSKLEMFCAYFYLSEVSLANKLSRLPIYCFAFLFVQIEKVIEFFFRLKYFLVKILFH